MSLIRSFSEQTLRATRARWLTAFSMTAIGICFLRLAYLQLIRGSELMRASESNHTQVLVERAPRGRILDRNGDVLADDQPVFVALFSPLGLDPTLFEPLGRRLSDVLTVQGPEFHNRIFPPSPPKSMPPISDRP